MRPSRWRPLVAEATLEQVAERIGDSVDRLAGVVAKQSPPGQITRTVERDENGLVRLIVEEKPDGSLVLKRFDRGPDGLITRITEDPIAESGPTESSRLSELTCRPLTPNTRPTLSRASPISLVVRAWPVSE
jgi:hypothetical protein